MMLTNIYWRVIGNWQGIGSIHSVDTRVQDSPKQLRMSKETSWIWKHTLSGNISKCLGRLTKLPNCCIIKNSKSTRAGKVPVLICKSYWRRSTSMMDCIAKRGEATHLRLHIYTNCQKGMTRQKGTKTKTATNTFGSTECMAVFSKVDQSCGRPMAQTIEASCIQKED